MLPWHKFIGPGKILRSRPIVVTAVLIVLVAVWSAWLHISGDAKVSPILLRNGDRKDVVIELRFPPEKFHMLLLQELGRIQSVNGRNIHVLEVSPARIREFARHYWVASIDVNS